MRARNNKTGEIVSNFKMSSEYGTLSYVTSDGLLHVGNACDGEWSVLDEPDCSDDFDWALFRREAAKDILANMVSPAVVCYNLDQGMVERAVALADKLVKQLGGNVNIL